MLTMATVLLAIATMLGQYEDLVMEDYIYVTNIKSVSLSPLGQTLQPAVTYLDGGVMLECRYPMQICRYDYRAIIY